MVGRFAREVFRRSVSQCDGVVKMFTMSQVVCFGEDESKRRQEVVTSVDLLLLYDRIKVDAARSNFHALRST